MQGWEADHWPETTFIVWGELSVVHPTLLFRGDSFRNYFACFKPCIVEAALKQEEAQWYRWGYANELGSERAKPGSMHI